MRTAFKRRGKRKKRIEGEKQASPSTFSELIKKIYPDAVAVGIRHAEFYNMTLWEINSYIKSFNKKYEENLKNELIKYYRLADMIRVGIRADEFPEICEFFPDLFEEMKTEKIKSSWLSVAKKSEVIAHVK